MNSSWIFKIIGDHMPDNAVIAVDVGNNPYSFGRYFETKGQQRVLTSAYLGSIGFSFPAGMGAWAVTQAEPDFHGRPVYSASGKPCYTIHRLQPMPIYVVAKGFE
jgi:pyruvate oxidase